MKKTFLIILLSIIFIIILSFSYLPIKQKNSDIAARKKLLTYATLVIPETKTTVDFSSEIGTTSKYTEGDGEFAEHGIVTLLTDYVKPVANKSFVTFFAVNRGGSGTEIYLAVFVPGENSYQMKGYVFLGDRIKINSLRVDDNNNIFVTYKTHGVNQPMAETPTVLIKKTFTYRELIRMGIVKKNKIEKID